MIRNSLILCTLLFILNMSVSLNAEQPEKVLVLGFNSAMLNDVEERYLRESIMKKLSGAGISIIPIMQIESLIRNESLDIRKINRKNIAAICLRLDSSHAITGRIYKISGPMAGRMTSGGKYKSDISVYDRAAKNFFKLEVEFEGKENYLATIDSLSEKISAELMNILRKKNEKIYR